MVVEGVVEESVGRGVVVEVMVEVSGRGVVVVGLGLVVGVGSGIPERWSTSG